MFSGVGGRLLVHTAAMRQRNGPWSAYRSAVALAGRQAAILVALAMPSPAQELSSGARGPVEAGAYSFSDELGGFRIISASGTGSRSDPFVIQEEMNSATPVTMVIRTIRPIRPFDFSGLYANGYMHMRVEILNNSKLPWIEFEFELQEHLGKPSVFGDGLSFDQRRTDSDNISSTSFFEFSRAYEPYDRLLFRGGTIDHLETASFGFLLSDFTPRWEFFLVQDPRIPSS